jgi:hypothetical protein
MATFLDRVAAAGARVSFEARPSPVAPPVMPGPSDAEQTAGEEGLLSNPPMEDPGTGPNHTAAEMRSAMARAVLPETRRRDETSPAVPADSDIAPSPPPNLASSPASSFQGFQSAATEPGSSVPARGSALFLRQPLPSHGLARPESPVSHRGESAAARPKRPDAQVDLTSMRKAQADAQHRLGSPRIEASSSHAATVAPRAESIVASSRTLSTERTAEVVRDTSQNAETREASKPDSGPPRSGDRPAAESVVVTAPTPAIATPQLSPVLPRAGRNTEAETRVTIGRIDVLVNNQLPSQPPAPLTPRTSGRRRDDLRTRFVDRFTLRP